MVSLLCPTRGRPNLFARMVESASRLAREPLEILAYVDADDAAIHEYTIRFGSLIQVGAPVRVGQAWNALAVKATGQFLMMANDDLIFRTENWDVILEHFAESLPGDGIYVLYCDDGAGGNPQDRCAFPIVSRAFYNALGYYVPEHFNFLYHDTWLGEVGKLAGRLFYVPDICIEHMHFSYGKAAFDATYARHRVEPIHGGKGQADDARTFANLRPQREADAKTIRAAIAVKIGKAA